ncbi:MAG: FtsX-like permease family protein [Tannerellaceae bacterium]|jgi:putative ABC transport system permease protein|nr:FtsX-like permease family protein [Tannerellaceae bacterium]
MIRHILKIIWNERKLNAWLVMEYVITFCVLWFCCDYLYTMLRSYYGPQGYDINHVYMINMGEKPSEKELEDSDKYGFAMTFMERVKRYPDIENVAFAMASVPYGGTMWVGGFRINSDSVYIGLRQRHVSTEFFDVFKMKVDGQIFDWTDYADKDNVVISASGDNQFGGSNRDGSVWVPVPEVHTLHHGDEGETNPHKVTGRTEVIRDPYFEPAMSNVILPLRREDVSLVGDDKGNQIVVRVKPEADKDFAERFTRDMREQLFLGPYYLSSVASIEGMRTENDSLWGVKDRINSTYAVVLFLVVNIFLGILGSFRFRTQSRRSEIALRIALGASRRKVQAMVVAETLCLLAVATIAGTVVCLHLGDPETLRSLGIPTVDKVEWGIGREQYAINFILTVSFLALVSIVAVWHPARQASTTQPADALHDE